MAKEPSVSVWFDREGDFLEVMFEQKAGYFRETANDRVMKKVDQDGRMIGFHILQVSRVKRPLKISLKGTSAR